MKTLLISTLFLFLVPSIQAQYHLDQTSTWVYYNSQFQGPSTTQYYRTITIDGDSTIQGQTYFKRFIQGQDVVFSGPPSSTITPIPRQFFDLVRDDANHFYSYINGQDSMTMDFTKSLGDTLSIHGMCLDSIGQIDTLFLGTTPLRRWTFQNYDIQPYIEGVGTVSRFRLENDCSLVGNPYSLVCYEKQGEQLILDPNINCQVYNSIVNRELENMDIKIYPNPTFGKVQIEGLPAIEKTVEILNSNGQSVFVKQSTQENLTLNMEAYPQGAYFLRITSEKGSTAQMILKM